MVLWAKPHGPAPEPLFSVISLGSKDVVVFGVRVSGISYYFYEYLLNTRALPDPKSPPFSEGYFGSIKVFDSSGSFICFFLRNFTIITPSPNINRNTEAIEQAIITTKSIELLRGVSFFYNGFKKCL